jgi:colicin import membrane protein
MKNFTQFNEDMQSLRRNLDAISKQDAPAERLAQRRRIAAERSKTSASDFVERQKANIQAQKEKYAQMRQDYEERQEQLRAKRQAEKEKKEAERQARLERQNQQKEELYLEQTPIMKPNLYSQLVARRQAAQKSAHIKHVHQEIGAEARSQEAAHQARLKKLTGTP